MQSIELQDILRLKAAIAALAANPHPSSCKKLKGNNLDFYRVRVGDHRAVYAIAEDILLVLVVRVGRRSNIYDRL